MKKLTIFPIFIILILLGLSGCGNAGQWDTKKMDKSTISGLPNPNINMSIKEFDIKTSTDQLTLIITNLTSNQYTYSLDQVLEVNVGNIWYVVPLKSGIAIPSIAMILESRSTREDVFTLAPDYNDLKPGNYRAVKTFDSDQGTVTAIALFEII